MALTNFMTEQGNGLVRVRIIADTICNPHGHVSQGDVVLVDHSEYLALKHSHKAVLAAKDEVQAEAQALPEPAPAPQPKAKKGKS